VDPLQALFASPRGRAVARRAGLTPPPTLRRYRPGTPLLPGPALLGGAPGGRLLEPTRACLEAAKADVRLANGATEAGADVHVATEPGASAGGDRSERLGALVFDATGIADVAGLAVLPDFFAGPLRRLAPGGRVLVLATPPELLDGAARVAQRALEGFTRSLAKELRGGATAQLVQVAPGAEDRLASTLRFLASGRSAFVDGQVIRIGTAVAGPAIEDADQPLAGLGIVVTGAARGIGAALVAVLARDGATVLGVDVPAVASDLVAVTTAAGGQHLAADITLADAPARIARAAREHLGTLHGVVHNAGITRDRKLVNLESTDWQRVLDVNLVAPLRITAELVEGGTLGEGGRVVAVSSVSGIAGNVGQTNYAASKAGVIGMVDALAGDLAGRGITINAVAPGFI